MRTYEVDNRVYLLEVLVRRLNLYPQHLAFSLHVRENQSPERLFLAVRMLN
jgi:hypothetical protein